MTELSTGRYATFDPSMGVPVQTSPGRPRFPLRYDLTEQVRRLMPWGLLKLDGAEFDVRYRARLKELDPDALNDKFLDISTRHGGKRLVLLCFEDVHAGQLCHRRVFADWWRERTGQVVLEVEPPVRSGQNSHDGRSGQTRPDARPAQLRLLDEDAAR